LGCVGVNMNHLPRPLDRRNRFEPIYAEMNRPCRAVRHPPTGICSPSSSYGYRAAVGTSLEDATFVLHMIAKQSAPLSHIKFIVPHSAADPDAAQPPRQTGQSQSGHPNLAEAPSVTAKKFCTIRYATARKPHSPVPRSFRQDHLVTAATIGICRITRVQGDLRLYRALTAKRYRQNPPFTTRSAVRFRH